MENPTLPTNWLAALSNANHEWPEGQVTDTSTDQQKQRTQNGCAVFNIDKVRVISQRACLRRP